MFKTIHTGSYDFGVQPVSLVDIHSRGVDSAWMQKRAAALTKELKQIRPEMNKTALHLIAMGATEDYGPNRNADGFRRQPLRDRHDTFVKEGHVYKHHKNKDPQKASGQIKFSSFNEPMKRVELIVSVDNDKWANELEKLASGEDLSFSMAAKVPFDVCSICANEAPTRAHYCSCVRKMAGQVLADGRAVYVDNPNPTFFDISGVFRPADRIAYQLQKVASASTLTGADLAELEGLVPTFSSPAPLRHSKNTWQKRATLRKLSDIEKEIEVTAPGRPGTILDLSSALSPCGEALSDSDVETLSQGTQDRIDKLMGALGQVRVSLPLRDFIRIVMGDDTGGVSYSDIESHLPGVFSRILADNPEDVVSDGTYDPGGCMSELPMSLQGIISKMIPGLSLAEEPVQKRTTMVIIRNLPKPQLTSGKGIRSIKIATDNTGAEFIAREYAKYKLSFLADVMEKEGSELMSRLGVLQNYLV